MALKQEPIVKPFGGESRSISVQCGTDLRGVKLADDTVPLNWICTSTSLLNRPSAYISTRTSDTGPSLVSIVRTESSTWIPRNPAQYLRRIFQREHQLHSSHKGVILSAVWRESFSAICRPTRQGWRWRYSQRTLGTPAITELHV